MSSTTNTQIRAAELYYEDRMNQAEVAEALNISRASVSRLLIEARENGIVQVKVNISIERDAALCAELRSRFHLKEAIVIPRQSDHSHTLRQCSKVALQLLRGALKNNMTIGITWGEALSCICDLMDASSWNGCCHNVTVAQMVGALGTGDPRVDGIDLAYRMANALSGTYSNIYAPLFVDSETVYDHFIHEPQIGISIRRAEHLDIILTGVGSLNCSTTLERAGYLTNEDRDALAGRGAVGHLLGRMFDIRGNEIADVKRFVVGAELSSMRSAAWSIGIAASDFNAEAILGAIRGRYLNALVVDDELAKCMLALDV